MTVLIVGFGSIAKKHVKALKDLYPGVILYALRSKKNIAVDEGIINIYNWADMPGHIDFAIIATPTFLHVDALSVLLEKRIPVMIEKPIADTLEGLDVIAKKIVSQKAFVYVACNLRFLPVLQFLKKYIKENRTVINEVNIYCGSFLPSWRPYTNFRSNYSANENMGGGAHLDLFHELDYTYWIFGMPQQAKALKRSVSSLKISAVDYAAYWWEYEKFTAAITLNYYRPVVKRSIEIVFQDEIWNADLLKNEIKNSSNEIVFSNQEYNVLNTYVDQMKYFTDCINNKQEPVLNTFSESLKILKLCLS